MSARRGTAGRRRTSRCSPPRWPSPDTRDDRAPQRGIRARASGTTALILGDRMLRTKVAAAVFATAALAAADAQARITEIRIDSVEPFANGHVFGDAGAYVRINGAA